MIFHPLLPVLLTLLSPPTAPCFIVHYILYFAPQSIPLKYSLQMCHNSSFPYLVHLNEPLNLPNNRTFTRPITPVQMSDIKKVEVVYHHGGLYLDNDQNIEYECVKREICGLEGLYFLDWTYVKERWKKTVPLSFIYASKPGNQTLLRSLEGLDETRQGDSKGPRTVYFSGPSHMQQYRDGMSFVRIPKSCEHHRADRSWIQGKPKSQLSYQQSIQRRIIARYSQAHKKIIPKFVQLWQTHTVIYPKGFDLGGQSRIDGEFNHVEMLDSRECKVRVIRWAEGDKSRKMLEEFLRKYGEEINETVKVNKTATEKKQQIKDHQQKQKIKQKRGQNQSTPISQSIKPPQNKTTPTPPTTPPTTPIPTPKKQSRPIPPPPNKNQQFILDNFYLLILLLGLIITWAGVYCHRRTRCCRNNNYEKEDIKINRRVNRSGEHLEEEGIGEIASQRGFRGEMYGERIQTQESKKRQKQDERQKYEQEQQDDQQYQQQLEDSIDQEQKITAK